VIIHGLLAYGWTPGELSEYKGRIANKLKQYVDFDRLAEGEIQRLSCDSTGGRNDATDSETAVSSVPTEDNDTPCPIANSPASGSVTSFADEDNVASISSDSSPINIPQDGLGLLAEAALRDYEQSSSKRKRQCNAADLVGRYKSRGSISRSEQDDPAEVRVVYISDNISLITNAETRASYQCKLYLFYCL
jgi:hypothetical protein